MTKQSPFRKISSTLVKFGAILLSCSFGAMAAFLMDNNAYDKASAELVALFSLLMAGVLPTAVLAATILRSGGLSVSRINQYRFALIKQVRLWAGLFFIAFFAISLLIIGKNTDWKIGIPVSDIPILSAYQRISLMPLVNFLITFCVSLLALRMFTIFHGIRSLIAVSADIAISEAQQRDFGKFDEIQKEIDEIQPREGFGDQVSIRFSPKD